jgi:hypothetical protein
MKVEAAKTHRCVKSTKLECKVLNHWVVDSLVGLKHFWGRRSAPA